MELIPRIQEISDNGILVVCGALIIYIVLVGVNLLKKWAENKMAQEKRMPSVHRENIERRLMITPEVKGVLEKLRLQTHASRVYIFEFHNGAVSLGGLPFIYMSNTYEVLSETATSQKHARQQMPFSLYESLITQLLRKDVVTLDVANPVDDFEQIVYETVSKRGTILLVATKLLDEHKRVIGFLGVDYCDKMNKSLLRDDKEAIKEIEKIILREAHSLSTLLYVKIQQEVNS